MAKAFEHKDKKQASWEKQQAKLRDLGADGEPVRLGIMGGTFDPIHMGHLAAAQWAAQGAGLDMVMFLPAGVPVFKKGNDVCSADDRLQMCELAVAGNPLFAVSPIEVYRDGDTYTSDTLRTLNAQYPSNVELCFLVGSDTLNTLESWHETEVIARLCTIIAMARPGYQIDEQHVAHLRELGFTIEFVEAPRLDVSSSMLRERIVAGKSIEYLVPRKVVKYITKHGLYLPQGATEASDGECDVAAAVPASDPDRSITEEVVVQPSEGPIDYLSDDFYQLMSERVKRRVSKKRYEHILGVAETSEQMARRFGVDPRTARLAGLLHDWDKAYDNDAIRQRADELGLEIDPVIYHRMPQLLHGPTAAAALHREFPDMPGEILQAINRHTTGALNMSDLDMIVYVADGMEPTRTFDSAKRLREAYDSSTLPELYKLAFQLIVSGLLTWGKTMHPDTVILWNDLVLP